jgi:L-rhamnose isomerase
VFCQSDPDCAPTTASRDVTPRCILGQCTLLCRTTSACPQDSLCLPWNDPAIASMFPGFDGLCE